MRWMLLNYYSLNNNYCCSNWLPPGSCLSNSLAIIAIIWNLHFCTTKWWAGKWTYVLLFHVSYTPVHWIWFSSSKHVVNINSCSGFPKRVHKSMSPHHGFLIFVDAQVRSGNTLYWIIAMSVSWKVHFQHGNIRIARFLTFVESSNSCYEMHKNQRCCKNTCWLSRSSENDIIHSTSWPLPF